jgi:hypothetical protein
MWKIGDLWILAASWNLATGYQIRRCIPSHFKDFLSSYCICISFSVSFFSDESMLVLCEGEPLVWHVANNVLVSGDSDWYVVAFSGTYIYAFS